MESAQNPTPQAILASLWQSLSLPEEALTQLALPGREPVLPSSFRVDALAQVTIAGVALAAAEILYRRGGPRQQISVPIRHAAAEFLSERLQRINGQPPADAWDPTAGAYQCRDERWVRLHTNFPHHRDGVLALLECAPTREAVAKALQGWQALDFETAASAAGLCVAMMRSFAEWDAHPQGEAVATLPPIRLTRLAESEAAPKPLAAPEAGMRPLAGLRVLDLTRVIAGPVAGRVLAAHGADVLAINGPHLPAMDVLIPDVGRGKRSAALDLQEPEGRAQLAELVKGADIFLQGYRPGALAAYGFSTAELQRLNPQIIAVSLSAYGEVGPWAAKRGFDSLVQTATGFNHAEAEAAGEPQKPRPLPCQALDHGSGYLLALGALAAVLHRAERGGAWHVQVALAATGQWLRGLGRLPLDTTLPALRAEGWMEESTGGFGRQRMVRHAAALSESPAYWALPAEPLGSHPPGWM